MIERNGVAASERKTNRKRVFFGCIRAGKKKTNKKIEVDKVKLKNARYAIGLVGCVLLCSFVELTGKKAHGEVRKNKKKLEYA